MQVQVPEKRLSFLARICQGGMCVISGLKALPTALPALAVAAAGLFAPAAAVGQNRVIVQWKPGATHATRVAARRAAGVRFDSDLGNRSFQLVESAPAQTG